jgi:hypothetical protein
MKRLTIILFLLIPLISYSQNVVKTETTSNKYKNETAATTGDTLARVGVTTDAGGNIIHGSFLVGVLIGTHVASDTLIFKNGLGTVSTMILGSTASGTPLFVPIQARCDTSIIFIKKKTSDATVIYRYNY